MMKFSAVIFAIIAGSAAGQGFRGSAIQPDDGITWHDLQGDLEEVNLRGGDSNVMGRRLFGREAYDGMIPPPEWKHRYLTESLADRLQDSSFHGTYFDRMLAADGTWKPPTPGQIAEMLIAELKREQKNSYDGKADLGTAIARVAEKLVGESPITNATDAQWLIDSLILPPETPEAKEVEDIAIVAATNHSLCNAPGKCYNKKKAIEIKDFIKQVLDDDVRQGKEPDVDEMYTKIKEKFDIEAEHADKLVMSSSEIRLYLKKKMRQTERLVVKKALHPVAIKVKKALIDAGNNRTEFEDAIRAIGDFTEDNVAALLTALSVPEQRQVFEALEKPRKEMEIEQEEAKKIMATKLKPNHTYFVETGEVDNKGRRALRFVDHPDEMDIDKHVEHFKRERHRRRLESDAPEPEHLDDFQRRLFDHVEELQGHIRELRLACVPGETNTRCVADHLEEESRQLTAIAGQITTKLSPLSILLGEMKTARGTIDLVYTLADTVFFAIKIAANIPGAIGNVFKPVKNAMSPIHNIFKKIDTNSKNFDNGIRKNWDRSIGVVERVIASFDPSKIYFIVQAADTMATIGESQCMKSAVNGLAKADLVGSIETAVTFFKTYIENFVASLQSLTSALATAAWQSIQNTLQGIVNALEPVRRFFAPFEPIGWLIKKIVTIRPWFSAPRGQIRFGANRCDHGYYHGVLRNKCWENNSWSWERYFVPWRMRITCDHGGMDKHWTGWCANFVKNRPSSKWHGPGCSCGCFLCSCPRCWGPRCEGHGHHQTPWMPWRCHGGCPWGYKTIFDKCWRDNCGWGYGTAIDKTHCTKNAARAQNSRAGRCDHYNRRLPRGEGYLQDIGGICFSSCKPGETLLFGQCFPEGKLDVSIEKIFKAFDAVFNAIKNIPGFKELMKAIDTVVGAILKPVTDKVASFVGNALSGILPNFPTIPTDILPFNKFDHISLDMPSPPDLSAVTDLPGRILKNVIDALPPEFKGLAECGMDVNCVSRVLGLGNLPDLLDPIINVFEELMDVGNLIIELMSSITCGSMKTVMLPTSDVMAAVGFPDINACDTPISYCESYDFSEAKPALEKLKGVFEPLFTTLVNVVGRGRRLGPINELWLPIIGLNYGPGIVGDLHNIDWGTTKIETRSLFLAPFKWANSDFVREAGTAKRLGNTGEKQPVGLHVRIEGSLYFDMGILVRGGQPSFGIELGSKIEFKGGSAVGAYKILKDTIAETEGILEYWWTDQWLECYKPKTPSAMPPLFAPAKPPKSFGEVQWVRRLGEDSGFGDDEYYTDVELGHNESSPHDSSPYVGVDMSTAEERELSEDQHPGADAQDQNQRDLNVIPIDIPPIFQLVGRDGPPRDRMYKPNPGLEHACRVIQHDWLPAIKNAQVPEGCLFKDMVALDAEWSKRPKRQKPTKEETLKVATCARFWLGLKKGLDGHEKVYKRRRADAQALKEKNPRKAKLANFGAIAFEDIRDILIVKTQWITNLWHAFNKKATQPAKFFGAGTALGVSKIQDFIGFAVGFEIKDNKSKSRLGPQFKFNLADIRKMGNKNPPIEYKVTHRLVALCSDGINSVQTLYKGVRCGKNAQGQDKIRWTSMQTISPNHPVYNTAASCSWNQDGTYATPGWKADWLGGCGTPPNQLSSAGMPQTVNQLSTVYNLTPNKFNIGEFKFRQIWDLIGYGVGKTGIQKLQKIAKTKADMWTGERDQFGSAYGVVSLGGVVDIFSPAKKGCYYDVPVGASKLAGNEAPSSKNTISKCVYYCRSQHKGYGLMKNGGNCYCGDRSIFDSNNPKRINPAPAGTNFCNLKCSDGLECGGAQHFTVWSTNGVFF